MMEKMVQLMQPDFTIPRIFLSQYKSLNITDFECILLIYLMNEKDFIFNPKKIGNDLHIPLKQIMVSIDQLANKGILSIDSKLVHEVHTEYINLDSLYKKMALFIIKPIDEKKEKNNLFDVFEKEFGRTLSPMEYEIIGAWSSEYTEDMIVMALKEATYNGASSLRYIDKILLDWSKKGIKTKQDIETYHKKYKNKVTSNKIFEYDWLNQHD